MITSIVFSKNRPLQLDLCLDSITKNFPDCDQIIVINNNDDEFQEAHQVLCREHKNIESWQQSHSIFRDAHTAILASNNKYICFFTDDCICYSFIPKYNYDNLFEGEFGELISCFSLRMGLNITTRYHAGNVIADNVKVYHQEEEYILWSKTLHKYGDYWSYSLSVDGHIFKQKDILEMTDELCYLEDRYKWNQTPNEFESALQRFWTVTQNCMAAFFESKVVNSPNNRVQSHTENASGDQHDYSPEYLLGRYLRGDRVNIDYLDFDDIKCPHTEIDLMRGII